MRPRTLSHPTPPNHAPRPAAHRRPGLAPWLLFAFFALLAFPRTVPAQPLHDAELGFSITIPDGFSPEPTIKASSPNILYAFRRPGTAGSMGHIIIIERMNGVLGRDRLDPAKMPKGFNGNIIHLPWKDFEIEGFEVPESVGGVDLLTENIQVPLKPRAIQLKVVGLAKDQAEIRAIADALLLSVDGPTNWIPSALPPSLSKSSAYSGTLIAVTIALVASGILLIAVASRRHSLGAGLLICGLLFLAGFAFAGAESREGKAASGGLRVTGVGGAIAAGLARIGAGKKSKTA